MIFFRLSVFMLIYGFSTFCNAWSWSFMLPERVGGGSGWFEFRVYERYENIDYSPRRFHAVMTCISSDFTYSILGKDGVHVSGDESELNDEFVGNVNRCLVDGGLNYTGVDKILVPRFNSRPLIPSEDHYSKILK